MKYDYCHQSLPPEILYHIFSHFRPGRRKDDKILRNLALSHSSFRPIAQKIGWSTVLLMFDWEAIDQLHPPFVTPDGKGRYGPLRHTELLIGNGALTSNRTAKVLAQLTSVERLKIQLPLTTRENPYEFVYDWTEVFPRVVSALKQHLLPTITSLWLGWIADFHYQLLVHCPLLEELVLEGTTHFSPFDRHKLDSVSAVKGCPPLKKLKLIDNKTPCLPVSQKSPSIPPLFWLIQHTSSTLKEVAFIDPLSTDGSAEKYILDFLTETLTTLTVSSSCFGSRKCWSPEAFFNILHPKRLPKLKTLSVESACPNDEFMITMVQWLASYLRKHQTQLGNRSHLFRNLHLSFLASYPSEPSSHKIAAWEILGKQLAPFIQEVTIFLEHFDAVSDRHGVGELQRTLMRKLLKNVTNREGVLKFRDKLSEYPSPYDGSDDDSDGEGETGTT
ncbi:hypothetical protein DL96DRAFT_1822682 [Flagelloscypha sp. PMI_526]|nr:hypothetical protein DL96DRAFT_1822682 [Flagelloscypha sp. PMI_526]